MIADDNAAGRELVRELLEQQGCEVLEAVDGRDALGKTRGFGPDLVLLDIQMPGLNGFDVLRQLRQDAALDAIPVVALTALAMEGDEQRARAAGFDAYLTKPIRARALRESVERILSTRCQPEGREAS